MSIPRFILVFACVALYTTGPHAKTFLTMDEALQTVYPEAEIRRHTEFLTREQQKDIERVAGSKLTTTIVHPYEIWQDNQRIAVVFFDAHRVRTLPQTIMVAIDANGVIQTVRVLVFAEPEEYLAPPKWLDQFNNQTLTDRLRMDHDIDGITGATLTARATTLAVRRMAALHHMLYPSTP